MYQHSESLGRFRPHQHRSEEGLAPGHATLELDVVDVDAGINDVRVNALAAFRFVLAESGGSQAEPLVVRNTRKTLKRDISTNYAARAGSRNIPMEQSAGYPRHERRRLIRHKQPPASL